MSTSRPIFRPLVQQGNARPADAVALAGGAGWFTHVEALSGTAEPRILPVGEAPIKPLESLTKARADIAGLSMNTARVMGILNATPDSFSDGGRHAAAVDAVRAGMGMAEAGADILDIGGESTRPGAVTVPVEEEIARVVPVIAGLREAGFDGVVSIDTRKAEVARAALEAGANLINDVSGLTYDPQMPDLAAGAGVPVCVMHAQGDPATMQRAPQYQNVVWDVFTYLSARIEALVKTGLPQERIIADPGIGFGKTLEHNLALLERLSLFHALGVPLLLGASRKRFVGTISGVTEADQRLAGSLGVALAGIGQGVQILRVHDVAETRQAIALWQASMAGRHP